MIDNLGTYFSQGYKHVIPERKESELPDFFFLCLNYKLLVVFFFFAHRKPKEANSPKVKNMDG